MTLPSQGPAPHAGPGNGSVPALELTGIDMHYGYVRALDGIDFHVMPGEVVGLLGDNGAGKSTLLKVMSGAHRPSAGTIRVRGQEADFHSPSDSTAAGIQMVYQDLALVDAQDISTNLNIGREILRRGPLGWLGFVDHKAMRRRSEQELDRLGVRTAPMTRPTEMLSGGQRQTVAIARSAIRVSGESHGVLLLDEPTAALGYEQTKQVEALIRRMADQGIAIVLVTHNLPLCNEVSDRMVILNRGRKVADVRTAETEGDHVVGWITGARPSMFASASTS
jgi:ABC-type sugar transport system ATPase subunit